MRIKRVVLKYHSNPTIFRVCIIHALPANQQLTQPGAHGPDEPPEWELFDCEKDPLELVNVAEHPDYADTFREMLARLDARMAAIGDVPEHDSEAVLATLV